MRVIGQLILIAVAIAICVACSDGSALPDGRCGTGMDGGAAVDAGDTDEPWENDPNVDPEACSWLAGEQTWFGDFGIRGPDDIETLSGYNAIQGHLTIAGSDLETLAGLEQLACVAGNVWLHDNRHLVSVDGLEGLERVGGSLTIEFPAYVSPHPGLEHLHGLQNLQRVGGDLALIGRYDVGIPGLHDLSGLESLTEIGGRLHLEECHGLVSLRGLENLETIAGGAYVRICHALHTMEALESLTTLPHIVVWSAHGLQDMRGLEHIEEMSALVIDNTGVVSLAGIEGLSAIESVTIRHNDSLQNLDGLEGITELDGLRLYHNDVLENVDGLQNLTHANHVGITSSPALASVEGLASLEELGSFSLSASEQLTSLRGLENLTAVTGSFHVGGHALLDNLDALSSLEIVGTFSVTRNTALPTCAAWELLDRLDGDPEVCIEENLADGCPDDVSGCPEWPGD